VLPGQDTFNANPPEETHVPKRARDRRTTPLAQLQARLDQVTGDGSCVALILPMIGLGMKCSRPCNRCRALEAEIERLRPEWDAAREAYLAEHPNRKPKRMVLGADADVPTA
jgi:hypothetical protein